MLADAEKLSAAHDIVGGFFSQEDLVGFEIEQLGKGHINDSFLLQICKGLYAGRYVLQRINRRVFPEPGKIMANLRVLADHFDRYGVDRETGGLETIRPLPALDGNDYAVDREQSCWRVINFVEDTIGCERIPLQRRAGEMGRALGLFHRITSNLDTSLFLDSLPGFHVTPLYLARYDRLMEKQIGAAGSSAEIYCGKVIAERREFVEVLEDAAKRGLIRTQVVHGDPKVDNILFDSQSGRAVALVDLDTVKPGLLHYDIGDCLRSSCNPVDEVDNVQDVVFDLEICREVLQGYFGEMGSLLTENDIDYIFPAIRLITFELGLRFFSDHMSGDVYFKTTRPDHNLQRAMVQFVLLESLEGMESVIRETITELRSYSP